MSMEEINRCPKCRTEYSITYTDDGLLNSIGPCKCPKKDKYNGMKPLDYALKLIKDHPERFPLLNKKEGIK